MVDTSRRSSDDKIFEMHGTISALAENIKQLRDDMSSVPMNAAEIIGLKGRLKAAEADIANLQKEQKVIEAAQIFFRVFKWILGLIIAIGGTVAVIRGMYNG